ADRAGGRGAAGRAQGRAGAAPAGRAASGHALRAAAGAPGGGAAAGDGVRAAADGGWRRAGSGFMGGPPPPDPPPPGGREFTGRGEQTRAAIFAAALALFQERGYEATTMRAIAERAGVSLGSSYHYYPSKSHLVLEFYRHVHERHQ